MQEVEKEKKINRDSNIELLRIISMFFIILHHYALYNKLYDLDASNPNKWIGVILFSLGKIGVNIFIIITGYFLINKKISVKKVLKLWFQVLFYSFGIYLLFAIIGKQQFSVKDTLEAIFPISYNQYWFITAYIILYLTIPSINIYVNKINKSQYKKVLILLFILLVLSHSIAYKAPTYSISASLPFSNLIFFIFLYLVGGYIKIYGISRLEVKNVKLFGYCTLSFIIYFVFLIICEFMDCKFNKFRDALQWYTRSNSIFVFEIAVLIFYFFKNVNLKQNEVINLFASASFGVYLIQSNKLCGNTLLYKNILGTTKFINSGLLIIHGIVSSIIIYIIGSFIDILRQKILENNIFKIKKFDNFFKKIDKYINIS